MARDGRRSIRIEDATRALITVGDNSPITVTRAESPLFALRPVQPALPAPPRGGPARLLDSRYELVDFVGREQVVARLLGWLEADEAAAAHLITGAGGQGKTRLAIHFARQATKLGWVVRIGRHKLDGALLAVAPDDAGNVLTDGPRTSNTLVIVDYVERWPRDDVLELVNRVDPAVGKIRFLFLARSDWFWPTLARTMEAVGIVASHHALPALSEPETRTRMRLAAEQAFKRELLPAQLITEDDQSVTPSSSLSSPLAIQMSALVDVLRIRDEGAILPNTRPRPAQNATALTRELLVREVQHWMGLRSTLPPPISISDRDMTSAVAVGTLTKGLTPEGALTLLPTLDFDASTRTVVHDHGVPYPPAVAGRVLEPLLPDRLAEDFLASFLPGAGYPDEQLLRSLCDPFAPILIRAVVAGGDVDRDGRYPLIVLIETARRWAHVADLLFELLQDDPTKLIECGSDAIVRAVPIPALRPLLPRIAEAIDSLVGVRQHVDLDMAALVVHEHLVEVAREEAGPSPRLASSLNTLAVRRLRVGQYNDATMAAEESVGLWEVLCGQDEWAYSIELASALGNLAAIKAELGDFRAAIEHSGRELRLTREANRLDGGAHRDALAGLLANRAGYLAAVRQLGDALPLARESVALHDALLRDNRENHLPNAAAALEGYGRILHQLGDARSATESFQRAVEIRRELAVLNPAVHTATLASSLTNFAVSLIGVQPDVGIAIAEESVALFRDLEQRNQKVFQGRLASALHVYAVGLVHSGRAPESIAPFDEAVELHRLSARSQRAEFAAPLAESLHARAFAMLAADQGLGALNSARQALAQYVYLMQSEPDLYSAAFAECSSLVRALEDEFGADPPLPTEGSSTE